MIQRWQIYIGLMLFSLFFAWVTVRRFHFLAVALLAFVLLSAVFIFSSPGYTTDLLSLRLRLVSARSFCLVTMLVFFVSTLSYFHVVKSLVLFEIVAMANSIALILFQVGIFNAASADMGFIMAVYPIIAFSGEPLRIPRGWAEACILIHRLAMIIIPLWALAVTKGSTAFFILGLTFATYLILTKRWLYILGLLPFVAWIGAKINSGDFLQHYDRTGPWLMFMNWWKDNAFLPLGTGTGTFQWIGPSIQNVLDPKNVDSMFIWMHNDFLQVLFEQGILGFGLMMALILVCLKRSLQIPWLFATNVGYLFLMFVQFPLRYLVPQLLALILIRISLEENENGLLRQLRPGRSSGP